MEAHSAEKRALVTPACGFVTASLAADVARTTMVGVYTMEGIVWRNSSLAGCVVAIAALTSANPARGQSTCTESDSAAVVAIRQRLAQWVTAWNRGDAASTAEIWAPDGSVELVGSVSREAAATDVAHTADDLGDPPSAAGGEAAFSLTVEDIAATGHLAQVRDVWVETRRLPGAGGTERRTIRGGEEWQCQSDGWWRITRRYFVAPGPWVRRPPE
jgi:hypothetical protein